MNQETLKKEENPKVYKIDSKSRMTITDVAEILGISTKTLARWEKTGKTRKPKRDWRGWRIYNEEDLAQIKNFHETVFEVE
ncbi:MAG: MerR family transcriptional regulator [Candidatus Omnitrophica bacterium]|nr:MerR family transcriptional regulator [Candidatus Omnitrophota bacterium]MDE2214396.1 MerR family transcriptional regulator [Candidatus Omnitrophota bacterium]MDE2231536.1 MerR family transcriptional regulator [Candidatus Omnitrophota bacterium]